MVRKMYIYTTYDTRYARYFLAGVRRPAWVPLRRRRATRSGNEITGPDINLDFSEAHVCHESCGGTRLGSCNVAPDRCPAEKYMKSPGTKWRARRRSTTLSDSEP